MKKKHLRILYLALTILVTTIFKAQLSGTYFVPATYSSIAGAVNALNVYGVSGPVIISVAAGYTETAVSGGISLNKVVGSSSVNTVTFQKTGIGANPLLIAYTGGVGTPSSTTQDGVWRFIGCDYITIDGIDITDPNTTSPSTMEYGYGFFKLNSTNGCQYNVIKNCTITLKKTNNAAATSISLPGGSRGIEMANSIYTSHTSNVSVSSSSGSNSYNKFYSNTIQNCNIGISIQGYTSTTVATNYDTNNDIGGISAVTGNTLINFGGGGTVMAAGVYAKGQYSINISANYINSNNGSGVSHLGTFRCISNDITRSANVSILNNTLSVNTGSTAYDVMAIYNNGIGAAGDNTVTISNNLIASGTSSIQFNGFNYNGIYNSAAAKYLLVTGNTFTNNTVLMFMSSFSFINNTGTVTSNVDISNNELAVNMVGSITSSTITGILSTSGTNSTNIAVNNNSFSQLSGSGPAITTNFISMSGLSGTLQINNNTWNTISTGISGPMSLIKNASNTTNFLSVSNNSIISGFTRTVASNTLTCYSGINNSPGSCNMTASGNNFSNITSTVSGTGRFTGFDFQEGNAVPYPNKQIFNNVLSNINYNASGPFIGFSISGLGEGSLSLSSAVHHNTVSNVSYKGGVTGMNIDHTLFQLNFPKIYQNKILNLLTTTSGGGVTGVFLSSYNSSISYYENIISHLTAPTGYVYGLECYQNSTMNVYNNIIGDLNGSYLRGILFTYAAVSNMYFNTIHLSGAVVGASCVATDNVTMPGSSFLMKNNIFVNQCTASGSGSIIAVHKDAYTNYNTNSNNNVFYAGTPGSSNALLCFGLSTYSTLAAAQATLGGGETASGIENVPFASTTWSNTNYLSINSSSPTITESAGVPISGIPTDFYGTMRNAINPDIGAIEGNNLLSGSDISPPGVIDFGFSTSSCNTAGRTCTVSIADYSGVASGTSSPILYYKKNSGAYSTAQGTLSAGTSSLGVWSFDLTYSASYNDVISYYLAVQDAAFIPNLSTFPIVVNPGLSVSSITNAPVPLTYTVYQALGGTYNVGASGTFTSLTSAAKAYNNACLTGPVTFILNDAVYSTNEIYPVTFKKNSDASATNSLLIIPAPNVTVTITGTNTTDTALIKFHDARYITINGLNTLGSGIKIVNASTAKPSANILVGSTNLPGGGCHHIQIEKLLFSSSVTNTISFGILVGSSVQDYIYAALSGVNNNDISIKQNTFTTLNYPIYGNAVNNATLTGLFQNWTVSDNQVGPTTFSTSNVGNGISISGCKGLSITGNTISNVSSQYNHPVGIGISASDSVFIMNNTISSVKCGSNTASFGLSVTGSSEVLIQNNLIVDIGFTTLGNICEPKGVSLSGNDFKFYNNTVAMTQSNSVVYAPWYLTSIGMEIVGGSQNIDMRNNIIYNNINNTFSSASFSKLMDVADGAASFSNLDHNNYFTSGPGSTYGYALGTNATTLEPEFITPKDGHLNPSSLKNYYIDNLGAPLLGVTLDIDQQTRNSVTPDVGADEFTSAASCTDAVAGTISGPTQYTICSSAPLTLSSATVSAGVDIVNRWQISSTSAGTYTDVSTGSGYTTPNYTIGGLPDGTYYFKLSTSCPAYSLSNVSNIATVTIVSPPTLSLSIPQTTLCSGTSLILSATGANNYQWSTGSTSSSITIAPGVSTSYYLIYKNNPCPADTISNINIFIQPSPTITAVSSSTSVCSGIQATLTASGAITYSWSNGATAAIINPTPTTNTTYTVTGFNSNGCGYTATRSIAVLSSPNLSVTGSSTICSGQSTTLTASGALSYTWNGTAVIASVAVSPATNTIYSVLGKNSNSCTTTSFFTVNVIPAFTINISGPNSTCMSQSLTLTASGANNYTWSTGAFTSTISPAPSSTSTYVVIGESGGCSINASKIVTVVATPTVSISGNTLVCSGQTTALNASGAINYTWSTGANTSSIGISPATLTNYTVYGDNNGCIAQNTISIATATIPIITVVKSASNVCPNSTVTFTAAGATTYTWSNAAIGNTTTASPSSAAVFTVSGSNPAGCVTSETVSIATYSIPIITVNPPSATVCVLSPVTFTGSGASTYTWNGTLTGSMVTLNPASSVVYQVSGSSAQGCTNTAFFAVTTNPLPALSVSPPSSTVCSGSTVSFTASGANTYTWNGSIVSANITFLPFGNTSYTVAATGALGCTTSTTVAVTSASLPAVSVTSSTSTICPSSPVNFTAAGASTYSWSNGATGNIVTISPPAATIFTVTGVSSQGCNSTATIGINTNSLPIINVTPPAATVCALSSVGFTASGASSYTWNGIPGINTQTLSPPSSIIYQVSGSSAQGCTSTVFFAVTANPLPTLSVSPPSATVCYGSAVNFSASGASSYTWNGVFQGTSVSFLPLTSTVYTISGTGLQGCISTATIGVAINSTPSLSVSPSSVTLCSLSSATFNATGANTYSWSNGFSGNPVTVTPTLATVYTVTGTTTNGCSATTTISVVTNSLPVLSLSPNSPSVCPMTPVTFTASGAGTYSWSSGASGTLATISTSNSSIYMLTGVDAANGCVNTKTFAITALIQPNVSISGTNNICAGQTATLIANGATSYIWNGSFTTSVLSVAPASTANYSLLGTASNGCVNSASITVTVNPLPMVSITANSLICLGNTVTLSATGASTYLWNNSVSAATITLTPSSTAQYSVTGTDLNGCQNAASINVSVVALPVVTASSSIVQLCSGTPVVFQSSGANTFQWTGGVMNNTPFYPTLSGTYTVTGTDINNCQGTATISISVKASPTLVVSNDKPVLCKGDSTQLFVSGADFYLWNTNDTVPTITVKSDTTIAFTIIGTAQNGCTDTLSYIQLVYDCTGMMQIEPTASESIRLYPNPNYGVFYIEAGSDSKNLTLEIYDVLGKLINIEKITEKITAHNLMDFSKGVYTIRIIENETVIRHFKLVKQ